MRSYKLRGAYNLMVQLDDAERAAGVVAASAGNHAQGVAFACKAMGVPGRIYVPRNTPRQKRDRIRVHGGDFVELIPIGDTFDDAAAAAVDDVARTGATMVPPFDDARTVAGQGTIGAEILRQLPEPPDTVVVPVGGGGCVGGHRDLPAEALAAVGGCRGRAGRRGVHDCRARGGHAGDAARDRSLRRRRRRPPCR